MTLRGKFLAHNGVLVLMLLLLGAASLWGLWGLRRQVDLALFEYANLQLIESAISDAAKARGLLSAAPAETAAAITHLEAAHRRARSFGGTDGRDEFTDVYDREKRMSDFAAARAADAIAKLKETPVAPETMAELLATIDAMLADMHEVATSCHGFIQETQAAATRRLRTTIWTMGGLSLIAIIVALLATLSQYRLVFTPLQKLRRGVKHVADKQFAARVDEQGDAEYRELAREFNAMAATLESFYATLEAQVAAKSKELVRSERLASVGFLAAGVAHEINNPLSIISGYAELSLKALLDSEDEDPQSIAEAAQGLRIIRDESFRCKEITEKLLSLAKSGMRDKEPCSIAQLAEEVTSMIRGLQTYRDRRVLLGVEKEESLTVIANPNEIKQVLLNLTINALEATRPREGEVRVAAKRVNEWVEFEVSDNGRGMSPEIVDHVFEPFFTAKRGVSEPGTGLGLSITHAIIENHGGQVRAASDGPGKGSRFIVRLPAAGCRSPLQQTAGA